MSSNECPEKNLRKESKFFLKLELGIYKTFYGLKIGKIFGASRRVNEYNIFYLYILPERKRFLFEQCWLNYTSFFGLFNLGISLPSRKQLAGPLLDDCYLEMKRKVDQILSSVNAVCLITDAWTNISGESVVNYIAASPKKTFFIESVVTGDQSHTDDYIAKDIARVIDSIACDVVGVVTDNTNANKAAWKILEQKYPDKFFQGCASHALHLLVKDIFSDSKSKPKNFPFDYLTDFADKCKDIVVFFKNHHALNHTLHNMQAEKLVLPAATRWGSLYGCFKSLLASEEVLFSIVNTSDFISKSPANQKKARLQIKDTISGSCFVKILKKALAILGPIDDLIVLFQNDSLPISDVYIGFLNLPEKYEISEADEKMLEAAEISYIKSLIKSRFQFIYGDAHGLGYILDPRYVGEKMERDLRSFESIGHTPWAIDVNNYLKIIVPIK
uniref:DUF659 domain-containing protein n=1 Tax=Romanomermis culicivorax TaxID=13658 RepID=A0A915JUS9_ROMCU